MDKKDRAIALIGEAENIISFAREEMDEQKHFHVTGELLAVDTILCKILKSQRSGY